MLETRPAEQSDRTEVEELLSELDLAYPSQEYRGFWMARDGGRIVGIAQVIELDDKIFICSVGTAPDRQREGIATKLLQAIHDHYKKDAYLYTVIPNYFSRVGFVQTEFDDGLPSQKMFACENCTPEKCACMLRKYDDSKIPPV